MGLPSKRPPFWTFDRYRDPILMLARDIYTPGMRNAYTIS